MMTHRNYRVVHHTRPAPGDEVDDVYEIHEVYYAGDRIVAWTTDAMSPLGDVLADLASDLRAMLEALEKPVLERDDLPVSRDTKGCESTGSLITSDIGQEGTL